MTDFDVMAAARVIAPAMGADWQAAPGYYSPGQDALLRGPDGLAVHVETITQAGSRRLVLSGAFDSAIHERAYNEGRHEITVSSERAPARIAAEVKRRLLPDYQRALADAVERKLRSNAERAARDQLVADLAAALGTRVREHLGSSNDSYRYIDTGSWGGLNGEARVTGSTRDVKFTLSVPAAAAVELGTHIAALRAKFGAGHG